MDNDDYYLPEAIELYYNTIKSEDSDLVMSSHYHGYDDKLLKVNYIDTGEKLINFNPTGDQKTFDLLSVSHLAPWAKMWKKEIVLKYDVKFLDDCLCEDSFFYFNFIVHAKKVTLLPNNQCYVYTISEDSTIHEHTLKVFNNYFKGATRTINALMDSTDLSKRVTISEHLGAILLMFSNLSSENKKIAVREIYDFETNLNHEISIDKIELNVLNNLILAKHFTLASKLATFYRFLYDNKTIRQIYRKYNNWKNNKKLN
jgi:hypothetical protein